MIPAGIVWQGLFAALILEMTRLSAPKAHHFIGTVRIIDSSRTVSPRLLVVLVLILILIHVLSILGVQLIARRIVGSSKPLDGVLVMVKVLFHIDEMSRELFVGLRHPIQCIFKIICSHGYFFHFCLVDCSCSGLRGSGCSSSRGSLQNLGRGLPVRGLFIFSN